jgi:hypothetical protein
MLFDAIRLESVFRLPDDGASDVSDDLMDWRNLSISYVASIEMSLGQSYAIRVDAIPLVYECLSAFSSWEGNGIVEIQIGEGWWLVGNKVEGDTQRLRFEFAAGGSVENLGTVEVNTDEVFIILSKILSDLVDALDVAGFDVRGCIRRFPIHSYRR